MFDIRSLVFAFAAALALAGAAPAHAASPLFRVDPYWPQPLPNNWILGQVGGMAVDATTTSGCSSGRARSPTTRRARRSIRRASKCCVPAPSVLVFNQAGDLVKSWGGPGDNLGYDWPLQEHGILVDNKGFVWLSGNGKGDNMVLKFTVDGKFVKQIGKSGPLTSSTDLTQFGQVAALDFDPTGQRNLRRGRLWQSPRRRVRRRHRRDQEHLGRVRQSADRRELCRRTTADSPQFANPVHCIALGKDGFVYVCDRTNNRVQVFRKDGSFVRQYVFDPKTRGPARPGASRSRRATGSRTTSS